jgi:hypothetical protein
VRIFIKWVLTATNLKLIITLRYHTECNQLQLFIQVTSYDLSAADGAVCNTWNRTTLLLACTIIYDLIFQMTVCADRSVTKLKIVWQLRIHTYSLTYSMQHSPSWEDNRFAASQEIPRILWKLMVNYRIHKCPPPVSILSQLNPVHTPTSHFLKIRLNIILPSTPGSPQWSLSHRFSHQNPVHTSPLRHPRYMPRPSHYSRFYHPHNSGWAVQIRVHIFLIQHRQIGYF